MSKRVKFVGGPFHGTQHEIQDDWVEMRLPVFQDDYGNIEYITYAQPTLDEFVFKGKESSENALNLPLIATPDVVKTSNFIFQLEKVSPAKTRGYKDQTDWCEHQIVVKNLHACCKDASVTFQVWSMQNQYTVERVKQTKYNLANMDFMESTQSLADFYYGLGKILEQNGFIKLKDH